MTLDTRLALVMHHRELPKPTATGPLALEVLTNSQLFVHGVRDSPLDLHSLHQEGRRVLVLFPAEDARSLDQVVQDSDHRPITLVVPDGSWRQARKVPKRIPGLEQTECVTLPVGAPTAWGIRTETVAGGLATFEAIARAFGILESTEVQRQLEELFARLVSATKRARGVSTGDSDSEQPPNSDALNIVFRDEHLVAINKPAGLLTHRGWAGDDLPAVQRLRDQIGCFVYPVHRLDRSTSGVLIFALSSEVARDLQALFVRGEVTKRYLALCRGHDPNLGRVDHPLVSDDGILQSAVTDFRFLGAFERYGLYEATPLTGRTHQIRRHLKHLSHPIIGDVRYGKGEHNRIFRERFDFHRMALHCREMTFRHPRTSLVLSIRCELDGEMKALLQTLGLLTIASV